MNTELNDVLHQLAPEIVEVSGYFNSEEQITMGDILLIVNGLEGEHGRACRALDYPLAIRLGNVLDKLYVAAANDPPPFFPKPGRGRRDVRVRMIRAFGSDEHQPFQDPGELLSLCLSDVPLTPEFAMQLSQSPTLGIEQLRDLLNIKERVAHLRNVYENLPARYQLIVDPWLQVPNFSGKVISGWKR